MEDMTALNKKIRELFGDCYDADMYIESLEEDVEKLKERLRQAKQVNLTLLEKLHHAERDLEQQAELIENLLEE
ncbi:MAG: hypothetical protein DRI88_09075 [Bacteroidetes bacterium]|nr:MAG: hypothetical protein DRI88_09075 [Bacteroidota bacterium]